MNLHSSHIERVSGNWVLLLISSFIGIAYLFRKLFSKPALTGSINNRLSKIYLISEGFLTVIKEKENDLSNKDLSRLHKVSGNLLKMYIRLYTRLEKVEFINNQETKQISEDTLGCLYKLEAFTRNLYYATAPAIPEDRELIAYASSLSLGTAINH